jgi:hypothetical protein
VVQLGGNEEDSPGSSRGFDAAQDEARRAAERLLPKGTNRRKAISFALAALREARSTGARLRHEWTDEKEVRHPSSRYRAWCRRHDAEPDALGKQQATAASLSRQLTMLVVVNGIEGSGNVLDTLCSLADQSWPYWEATVVGPVTGFDDLRVRSVEAPATDTLTAANAVVSESETAEFVLFLNAGDRLAPDCLYHVGTSAIRDPSVDLVFWDDDLISASGRHDPRFRPSWSPETLLSEDVIGSSFAMRIGRFRAIGGLRPHLKEGSLWDLLLRADICEAHAHRVPRVLSHLVTRTASPPGSIELLREHLRRTGRPGSMVDSAGALRVKWELPSWPRVSIWPRPTIRTSR